MSKPSKYKLKNSRIKEDQKAMGRAIELFSKVPATHKLAEALIIAKGTHKNLAMVAQDAFYKPTEKITIVVKEIEDPITGYIVEDTPEYFLIKSDAFGPERLLKIYKQSIIMEIIDPKDFWK